MIKMAFLFCIALFFSNIHGQNQAIELNQSYGFNTDTDKFIYNGHYVGNYSIGWYSTPTSAEVRLSSYDGINLFTNKLNRLSISKSGNVGIGITDTKGFKLGVQGKIAAEEVKVAIYNSWADFVFENNYKLPSLNEVEQHIKEKGHLKDIPSAEDVKENGIFLGEMDSKLLQKIEELTLYVIEQQKEIESLKLENVKLQSLSARLEDIEKLLNYKK